MKMNTKKQILLVGNPNVGKSTAFNQICNRNQKTGNYAGVTVASHSGNYSYKGEEVEVIDLPGSYSLYPSSEDEAIFSKYLVDEVDTYSGVVFIVEAISLKRGLLLFQQIQDLGIPLILVVNQIDQAERRGVSIDIKGLSQALNVTVIAANAKSNIGIEEIKESIFNNDFKVQVQPKFEIPTEFKSKIAAVSQQKNEPNLYKVWSHIASGSKLNTVESIDDKLSNDDAKSIVPKRLQTQETVRRYKSIDGIVSSFVTSKPNVKQLLTEKLDRILVHNFWGYIIFAFLLLLIFESVFFLASYPMDWIDGLFGYLSEQAEAALPEGPINSLVSSGIIPGIGGIVIFAPQIGILLYFLYLLEDSGYMARVVYLMDRLLRPFGLNGKSIVPLVSGTACAIPAIMSTRNIENIKERLITILVTPFMTCSARLPVYSIIIGLIIPDQYFGGISYKALALLGMYLLGFLMALVSAFILKKVIKNQETSYLVMDLPAYKKPLFGYDLKLVLEKVWGFISGAGKVIFVVSIIIWVLSYFGPSTAADRSVDTDVKLENSYLSKVGKSMEPVIEPLGYDWKMGVGILTSFAAREVFVGTISTLYSLDEEAPEGTVIDKMRHDVKPNGEPVFNFATGLSILVFYAFAMQCISTIAVVYRETESLRWTILQTVGMTFVAYLASFIVYQLFK